MDIAASSRSEVMWIKALLSAAVLTLMLFYLMHVLIRTDWVEPDSIPVSPIPPIYLEPRQPPVFHTYSRPTKVEPKATPNKVQIEHTTSRVTKGEGGEHVMFKAPPPDTEIGVGFNPGGVVQQVMIPPHYPERALTRGIEGFVVVSFNVTASGATDNVRVVRGEPAKLFDKSAIRAVKRWKYLPDPARSSNPVQLTEKIRFTIDQ